LSLHYALITVWAVNGDSVSGVNGGGGGPPWVTLSKGVTPKFKKKLWANLRRIVDKRGWPGKKGAGDTLQGVG